MNTKLQGNIGIGQAIAHFTSLSWIVSVPLTDSQKYDLLVDDGSKILRVQVKTSRFRLRSGVFQVMLKQCGGSRKAGTSTPFDNTAVDLLFVYCSNGSRYLIPCSQVNDRHTLTLYRAWEKYRIG
jgi:hypothetical protein